MRTTVLPTLVATLMLAACGQVEPPKGSLADGSESANQEAQQDSSVRFGLEITDDTPDAIKATIAMIAEARDIETDQVHLGFMQPMTFPNTCLAVAGLENCEDTPTDGYMMMFLVEGMTFLFHADESADTIHLVMPHSLTVEMEDFQS